MSLVKPRYAIPVHGEWRHLTEHAEFAKSLGIEPITVENGDVLRLAPGEPRIVESAPTGRLVPEEGGCCRWMAL